MTTLPCPHWLAGAMPECHHAFPLGSFNVSGIHSVIDKYNSSGALPPLLPWHVVRTRQPRACARCVAQRGGGKLWRISPLPSVQCMLTCAAWLLCHALQARSASTRGWTRAACLRLSKQVRAAAGLLGVWRSMAGLQAGAYSLPGWRAGCRHVQISSAAGCACVQWSLPQLYRFVETLWDNMSLAADATVEVWEEVPPPPPPPAANTSDNATGADGEAKAEEAGKREEDSKDSKAGKKEAAAAPAPAPEEAPKLRKRVVKVPLNVTGGLFAPGMNDTEMTVGGGEEWRAECLG